MCVYVMNVLRIRSGIGAEEFKRKAGELKIIFSFMFQCEWGHLSERQNEHPSTQMPLSPNQTLKSPP